jgi:hypothetical protein
MSNLLKETLELLERNNKKETDVKWVGSSTHKTTWADFKKNANVDYESGFGSPKVAGDLLVVGENWWLERGEYDGSEWWDYKEMPKEPTEIIELKALTVNQADDLGYDVSCGWENLLAINGTRV